MAKFVGILYSAGFAASAATARAYLRRKRNYQILLYKPFPGCAAVHEIPTASGQLDLMIWYSHGGWDGPVVFDIAGDIPFQIARSEPREWAQLKAYFNKQMKPKAAFLAHSCHSAGSDWREKKKAIMPSNQIWVKDIAQDMNLYTFGQAGRAGAKNSDTVKKMLDYLFTGKARGMPFHAFAPGTGAEIQGMKAFPKL